MIKSVLPNKVYTKSHNKNQKISKIVLLWKCSKLLQIFNTPTTRLLEMKRAYIVSVCGNVLPNNRKEFITARSFVTSFV